MRKTLVLVNCVLLLILLRNCESKEKKPLLEPDFWESIYGVPDWFFYKEDPHFLCISPPHSEHLEGNNLESEGYDRFGPHFSGPDLALALRSPSSNVWRITSNLRFWYYPNITDQKEWAKSEFNPDRNNARWILRDPNHRIEAYSVHYATNNSKAVNRFVGSMGLHWQVDATGIRSEKDGRVLKGWYHLKVTLLQNGNQSSEYIMDRIILGARGLTALKKEYKDYDEIMRKSGSPKPNEKVFYDVKNISREKGYSLVWTGGIGWFEYDFPRCKDIKEDKMQDSYIEQQFLTCGAASFREAVPGNNFIWVRKPGVKDANEVHVNFRIDHTQCTQYYKLDWIVVGIAIKKDKVEDLEYYGKDYGNYSAILYRSLWSMNEKNELHVQNLIRSSPYVEFSRSTRFELVNFDNVTDLPTYYGNADPIPNQAEVESCMVELKAGNAEGGASFFGAIKKIIKPQDRAGLNNAYFAHGSWSNQSRFKDGTEYPYVHRDITREYVTEFIKGGVKEWDEETGHPYYDATCKGYFGPRKEHFYYGSLSPLQRSLNRPRYNGRLDFATEDKYQSYWSGRCRSTYLAGPEGWEDYNLPEYCDVPFAENIEIDIKHDFLREIKRSYIKTKNEQPSQVWHRYYLRENRTGSELEGGRPNLCDIAKELEGYKCDVIGADPYTPNPPTRKIKPGLGGKQRANKAVKSADARGMRIDNPGSLYLWDSRTYHGVFMTIMVLFVIPVSAFLARYFKETFMDTRILNHHVWFIFHLFASVFIVLLSTVGMWRIVNSRKFLGTSIGLSSDAHRGLGWMVVVITGLMFIFGGWRCLDKKIRCVIIGMHWFLGNLAYVFGLICMFTSIYIPGSPSSYLDTSVYVPKFQNVRYEPIALTVIFWILFDIIAQIIMTVLLCKTDKKLDLTQPRHYFPSPMPVLTENYRFDIPGRRGRIIMLGIYIFISALCTGVCVGFIFGFNPQGRGLGAMTYSHHKDGSNGTLKVQDAFNSK